ncbi:MAG: CYTH domain-containing protein [Treponema sp.]|jgi:adenylate cyclase class 2|nr:CYTH domain-containing protein [Treponema sp.]
MIEIELKARVDDPHKTKSIISSFARYIKAFDKEDVYWRAREHGSALFSSGIRIRRETDYAENGSGVLQRSTHVWVTYKTKETRDCIEVNTEREFSISEDDAEKPFEELLALFGLQITLCKRKTGWAWRFEEDRLPDAKRSPPITIELSEVAGLGWFVEIEILTECSDEHTVAAARRRLLFCLGKTGIGEDKIETRYYTDMLREQNYTV